MFFHIPTQNFPCFNSQIRKSFFAELGFYENDTLVRIMYEDFIKGTEDYGGGMMQEDGGGGTVADYRRSDPKRAAFYDVSTG